MVMQTAIELFHDNSKKFETVSNGTQTTGRVYLNGTNGGFDYNNTAHTLEFLVANGSTHSELNNWCLCSSKALNNGGSNMDGLTSVGQYALSIKWIVLFGSASGSAAANTLDDYEEGTSTVSIQNITADTNTVVMTVTFGLEV